MDCIFCDIIEKKESAEILFENERVIAFLDIRPVNYGHTLVIPKKHYENFLSVPPEVLGDLIQTTQMLSKVIVKSLSPDGFNIVVNSGVAAGQSIFHFHFHIIPRFNSDDFKFRPNLKSYGDGTMKKFAEKIRSAITK
jgi:histidine triad (HIT) family protein